MERARRARRREEFDERGRAEAAVSEACAIAVRAAEAAEVDVDSVSAIQAEEAALEALTSALDWAEEVGVDEISTASARGHWEEMSAPAAVAMRARRRRAAEASKRLGGLSDAQRDFLLRRRRPCAACGAESAGVPPSMTCSTRDKSVEDLADKTAGAQRDGDALEENRSPPAAAMAIDSAKPSDDCAQQGAHADDSCEDSVADETALSPPAGSETLRVVLSYKGLNRLTSVSLNAKTDVLFQASSTCFDLPSDQYSIKLILKGKAIALGVPVSESFAGARAPKILVMATAAEAVKQLHEAQTTGAKVASFAAEHGSRKAGVPTAVGVRSRRAKN